MAAEDRTRHLAALTAVDAVARMSRGELSCERYAAALIERCRASRALNAFITLEPDRVLEDARARDRERKAGKALGPLFGLPIPVKDSVNTRDYPTTGGTPALKHFGRRRMHRWSPRSAPPAPSCSARPICTSCPTAGPAITWPSVQSTIRTIPRAFPAAAAAEPPPRSPRVSLPWASPEDTEGSIRVPAAFCGIVGFRPTTGRYSTRACVPISGLFDQAGPHARSVADIGLFDSVLVPDTPPFAPRPLRGVRLGIVRDYWYTGLDPEVERIADAALSRLKEAGAVLVETPLPDIGRLVGLTTDQVQNHDVRLALAQYLQEYGTV